MFPQTSLTALLLLSESKTVAWMAHRLETSALAARHDERQMAVASSAPRSSSVVAVAQLQEVEVPRCEGAVSHPPDVQAVATLPCSCSSQVAPSPSCSSTDLVPCPSPPSPTAPFSFPYPLSNWTHARQAYPKSHAFEASGEVYRRQEEEEQGCWGFPLPISFQRRWF